MKKVALYTHSRPGNTDAAIETVARIVSGRGYELTVSERDLPAGSERAPIQGASLQDELPDGPDVCIALGGDGTILRALRRYADTGVPVFGFNYGTVGFLAAAEPEDLERGLESALSGDFETVRLPGLEVRAGSRELIAVNDVSFTRRPHQRVAELSYRVGGSEAGRVRCDGLVAATPVGSTGYNLANHGPVLAWGVEGFVVSFIAPHTLTARALVVAPDDVLKVFNIADRDPVDLAIDGIAIDEVAPGAEVEIGFRDNVATLAQLPGETFYKRMREKFGRLAH